MHLSLLNIDNVSTKDLFFIIINFNNLPKE